MEVIFRLEMENPFGPETSSPEVVRFVSISSKTVQDKVSLPIAIPKKWGLVCTNYRGERSPRVWSVQESYEDHRLPWPDRYAVWRPCDNTQVEHNTFSAADFERPRSFCENEAQC